MARLVSQYFLNGKYVRDWLENVYSQISSRYQLMYHVHRGLLTLLTYFALLIITLPPSSFAIGNNADNGYICELHYC